MTTDESLTAIAAGDQVKVYDINGTRAGQPLNGWDGKITKIGRDLVHITYPGYKGGRQPQTFRKDTHNTPDGRGQRSFRTLAAVALRDRRHAAEAVLQTHGLTSLSDYRVPLATLEAVADTLRSLPPTEG